MPRAKKKSAKGSNFKEDDSALVLMCYYSMPLGVSMYILAPVNADLYIEKNMDHLILLSIGIVSRY